MKPLMTQSEIFFLEDSLLALARKTARLHCLEWGAGGSTVHFTQFLDSHGIDYRWLSLEHDRTWFEQVAAATEGNRKVQLRHIDIGPGDPHWKHVTMDSYVDFPRTLRRKFDFILVDGRKRRRCLIEAASVAKPGGIVALHDASRPHYHCAFAQYRVSHFALPELWIGGVGRTLTEPRVFRRAAKRLRGGLGRYS
jgi:hypothetical protein